MRTLTLAGLVLLFLTSCDWGRTIDEVHWTFSEYKNLSERDLKISIYDKGKLKVVDLPHLKMYKDSIEAMGGSNGGLISNADSLIITYNNDRRQKFYKRLDNISDRNPMVGDAYEVIHNSNRKMIRRYTFTPQDYENAAPCNGNCD